MQGTNLGISLDENGNVALAFGQMVIGMSPADALALAGGICGLVAQAQRPRVVQPDRRLVIAGSLPNGQ